MPQADCDAERQTEKKRKSEESWSWDFKVHHANRDHRCRQTHEHSVKCKFVSRAKRAINWQLPNTKHGINCRRPHGNINFHWLLNWWCCERCVFVYFVFGMEILHVHAHTQQTHSALDQLLCWFLNRSINEIHYFFLFKFPFVELKNSYFHSYHWHGAFSCKSTISTTRGFTKHTAQFHVRA